MQDEFLWDKLRESVTPIKKQQYPQRPVRRINLSEKPHESGVRIAPFNDTVLVKGDIAGMDKSTGNRFRKGKIRPKSRLDLHGYTVEEAFRKVKSFIYSEYDKGSRCVLIITGRGKTVVDDMGRINVNTGILYNELPKWLNCRDIRGYIVSFVSAVEFDGGEGAVYVYLKSSSKETKKKDNI